MMKDLEKEKLIVKKAATIGTILDSKRKRKKAEFPLKSALKRNKEKKSERRQNFFDARGEVGSSEDDYFSANMIYFSDAVIEDQEEEINEETAFVIITAKMQAAFSAVF